MKKKISSMVLVGALKLGSAGVGSAATTFVKAYLVKSSVSVDGKKVSSNVYKINNDYYIKAKSLKTGNLDSSVSSNKIVITNKLTQKVNALQSQLKTLNSKYNGLENEYNGLVDDYNGLQSQDNKRKGIIESLMTGRPFNLIGWYYVVDVDHLDNFSSPKLLEGTYSFDYTGGTDGHAEVNVYDENNNIIEIDSLNYDKGEVSISLKKGYGVAVYTTNAIINATRNGK
ncbi:hypothetical protein [Gottfriedia acidiceleris]|uniref:hypothetical protein n=1 Tax=Gottfriedia acidiceleris TaxID=371036 RepID=UPI00300014CA